jgi:hypothetical protein
MPVAQLNALTETIHKDMAVVVGGWDAKLRGIRRWSPDARGRLNARRMPMKAAVLVAFYDSYEHLVRLEGQRTGKG